MKTFHGSGEGFSSGTEAANEERVCDDKGSSEKGILSQDELLIAAGVSLRALKKFEAIKYVTAESSSNGARYYSQEAAEHLKSMMSCQGGRCANLQEAHEIARESTLEKEKRKLRARSRQVGTRDPREIEMHPTFKDLLPIDEDLLESIKVDMTQKGYYTSKPVVLGMWPGLERPVLIDGHTRLRAAIAAGIEEIPVVIEERASEVAALRHAMSLQTKRRRTGDDVIFRLIERYDELMERGRPPRNDEAKEIPTRVGIFGHSPSAQRMAHLLTCNRGKVEKVRKILRDGTPEIRTAVRNGKMTINKGYNAIIEKGRGEKVRTLVKLRPRNLAALEDLGGSLEDHVNTAVEQYIESLREEEGFAAENAERAEGKKRRNQEN
jgi:DNA-binding transcriptional MerR regulator